MRLIDADELKKRIIASSLYLISTVDSTDRHIIDSFTEAFIKIINKAPSVSHHYDCNHDCDAIYKAYQKGREDALKEVKK